MATPEILEAVRKTIVEPTLAGLAKEGVDYRGTLYVGIMITKAGPKVVEFNVRFGDPECQVLMPLLESDPLELMYDAACGKLDPAKVKIADGFAAVVVMCARGYPGKYAKGDEISLPESAPAGSQIIHAGTRREGDKILTAGGRVLGLSGFGQDAGRGARQRLRARRFREVRRRVLPSGHSPQGARTARGQIAGESPNRI